MKRLMLLAVLPLCATAIHGEGLYVGYKESATVDVPAETSETRAPVYVDGNGTFDKTGAGELQIPLAAIWQNNPFAARVREGSLTLTSGAAPTFETPTETLGKAAFWVHAGAGLVVSNGTYVYEWNDAREGSETPVAYDSENPIAGRRYPYAKTQWDLGMTDNPFFGIGASYVTRDAGPAIYFNGHGKNRSCQYMRWMNPDGREKADITGVTDIFVVIDCEESYGPVISPGNDPNDMQAGYNSFLGQAVYFSTFVSSALAVQDNAVLCRDGVRIDPTSSVSAGLQVLDLRFAVTKAHVGAFFAERPDKVTKPGDPLSGRVGGDYISEAIVFTNALTTAERMKVQQYLLRKWGKARLPEIRLATAEGASVGVDVSSGKNVPLGSVGDVETLVKSGTGELAMGVDADETLELKLEDGAVHLRSPVSLELASGKTVSANSLVGSWSAGTDVTKTDDAGAGRMVKTGDGEIRTDRIAADVGTLEVQAGTLSVGVRRPFKGASFNPDWPTNLPLAVVANHSFEDAEGSYPGSGIRYFAQSATAVKAKDWWGKKNGDSVATSGLGVGFFDTKNTDKWPTGGEVAPDGDWVLCLKKDVSAWTFITVDEPGAYSLEFWTGARTSVAANMVEVYAGAAAEGTDDPDVTTLTKFASVLPQKGPFVRQNAVLNLSSGRNVLYFRSPSVAVDTDRTVCIDNVRLSRVTGRIPFGDFECFVGNPDKTTRETQLYGWTIDCEGTFPSESSPQYASITPCLVDSRLTDNIPRFYPSEDSPYGKMGLLFYGTGGVAKTTFTPPKGVWRLKCRARRWNYGARLQSNTPFSAAGGVLKVSAVVRTADGDSVDLGKIAQEKSIMAEKVWDVPFEADGETKFTLELRQTNGLDPTDKDLGSGVIDDLDLESVGGDAGGGELIANGSFESDANWDFDPNADIGGNEKGRSMRLGNPPGSLWGVNTGYDGQYVWRVTQIGVARQSLTVPADGIYRLSFRTLSRHDGTGYGFNPIRVWLAANGATNLIARTDVTSTNFCGHVFYVRLKAGAYTFGLQGENDVSVTGLNDRSSLVDCVSLKRVGWMDGKTPDVPENLEVKVAEGAKLSLDFGGQLKLGRLTLGGRAVSGEISAAKRPDLAPYLSGPGEVYVEPRGAVLIFR